MFGKIFNKFDKIKKRYPNFGEREHYWSDLNKIMLSENIELWHDEKLPRDIEAMYFKGEGTYIIISSFLSGMQNREYAVCHELGHHFLHSDRLDINTGKLLLTDKEEVEAEYFAFYLYNPAGTAASKFWEMLRYGNYDDKFYSEAHDLLTSQRVLLRDHRKLTSRVILKPTSPEALDENLRVVGQLGNVCGLISMYKRVMNDLMGK